MNNSNWHLGIAPLQLPPQSSDQQHLPLSASFSLVVLDLQQLLQSILARLQSANLSAGSSDVPASQSEGEACSLMLDLGQHVSDVQVRPV